MDVTKMDLWGIGLKGLDWINLVQDRDQRRGSCEHSDEPSHFITAGNFLVI